MKQEELDDINSLNGFALCRGDLISFELAGDVYPSGIIEMHNGRFIKGWPATITHLSRTYKRKTIKDGSSDSETGTKHQTAFYI